MTSKTVKTSKTSKSTKPVRLSATLAKVEAMMAKIAASYPEVHEDRPWGHRAFKVRGKAFLFLATEGGRLSFSLKLPESRLAVLERADAEPTGYGLGKSGWVSLDLGPKTTLSETQVRAWIDESFGAIAPKKLSVALRVSEGGGGAPKQAPPKLNAVWHKAHRLSRSASTQERIDWHRAHVESCGCRPMPAKLAAIIAARSRAQM